MSKHISSKWDYCTAIFQCTLNFENFFQKRQVCCNLIAVVKESEWEELMCRFVSDKTDESSQCAETKREEAERKAVSIAANAETETCAFCVEEEEERGLDCAK